MTLISNPKNNLSVLISESPQNKDITLFTLKGFMDTNTAPVFELNFQTALRDKKFKLVVDLTEVEYISSAGWGLFVSEIKRLRQEKGDLVLAGMNENVLEVFDLLEFSTILKFYSSVKEAVQKGFLTNQWVKPATKRKGWWRRDKA